MGDMSLYQSLHLETIFKGLSLVSITEAFLLSLKLSGLRIFNQDQSRLSPNGQKRNQKPFGKKSSRDRTDATPHTETLNWRLLSCCKTYVSVSLQYHWKTSPVPLHLDAGGVVSLGHQLRVTLWGGRPAVEHTVDTEEGGGRGEGEGEGGGRVEVKRRVQST